MPLLLTPPTPILTFTQFEVGSLYAIIDAVSYTRRGLAPKRITASVGYYAHEAASRSTDPVAVPGLPTEFYQEAEPEQANSLPIFDFLEALLRQRLQAVLPAGTTIETVA